MLIRPFIVTALLLVAAVAGAAAPEPLPAAPTVDAKGYLLIDEASGQTLAELNSNQRLEPASITKLMSAYVVFHALKDGRLKLTDTALISEHAWRQEGSRTYLVLGSNVTIDVLLHGLIIQSGNDATVALAEKVAGTEPAFVEMMNAHAKRLGMTGTHYDNSPGLPSPTHYTTARDILILARAIIEEFPDRYALYSERSFTWNKISQPNRNGLLARDNSVDGMKTGHTDSAGYCLVTSAKRQGTRLLSVVLGSKNERSREDASAALLNYGFTFFETISIKKAHQLVLKPRVYKSAEEYVGIGPVTDVKVTVRRGQAGSITTTATVKDKLMAPLAATNAVGELQVTSATATQRVPLYPLAAVAEAGWWTRMTDTVALWFK
jgi:D-alanyl-D-alanine carboxypeptidase (penicillin-binding protein 5/6)